MKLKKTEQKRPLGLYLHIPFCERKCDYCDFLSAPGQSATKKQYTRALLNEIWSYTGKTSEYGVESIFLGGGTPSTMEATDLSELIKAIRKVFRVSDGAEISIEINPGTVDHEKLLLYQEAGINRISFGLQSTDNQELNRLGRIHTYETFLESYQLARTMGFRNINIDLMSALPGQTLETWENTLYQIVELEPEHISAYSLIIEEGTPFFERYGKGHNSDYPLPDEETDRLMYQRTKEILREHGYNRYEISNYARQGYESRHNRSYWIGSEYLGLGLGSSSLICNTRFHNETDLQEYLDLNRKQTKEKCNKDDQNTEMKKGLLLEDAIRIRRNQEILSKKQRMEEFMFLGLRMSSGVQKDEFYNRFGDPMESIYGDVIEKLIGEGLLITTENGYRLSDYGIDVSNVVLAKFLLDT